MSDEGVFKKGRFSVSLSGDELFISYRGAVVRVPCEGFLGMQYDENLGVIEIEYGKDGKTYLVKINVVGDGKKESENLASLIFLALSKYFNERGSRRDEESDEKEFSGGPPEIKVMVRENSDGEYKEFKDGERKDDYLINQNDNKRDERNASNGSDVENGKKKVKNDHDEGKTERKKVVSKKKNITVKKKNFWVAFFEKYDIYIIGAGTMSAIIIVLFVVSKLVGLV